MNAKRFPATSASEIRKAAEKVPRGRPNLDIDRNPYADTARKAAKIGATILLEVPDRRVPKKTKPSPGCCAKGLWRLEITISASSIARMVRVAPRDLVAIAGHPLGQVRSFCRRDRISAVASGTPIPIAVAAIGK